MRKTFSTEQIVGVLNRLERGEKAKDLCREIGVSSPTLYAWRQKYGGMGISDVKRLKELEVENSRLKKLIANMAIDIDILKDVNSRKW